MTEREFTELKLIIGRDIKIKLKKRNEEGYGIITFDWEFNYSMRRKVFQISDEYRKNDLSTLLGRYTLIYSKNGEDKIYTNVHDYTKYTMQVFFNSVGSRITDFDFIYAWDDFENKLVVIWECEKEIMKCKMNRFFAKSYLNQKYNDYKENSDMIFLDE